jgi:hypothetical protein
MGLGGACAGVLRFDACFGGSVGVDDREDPEPVMCCKCTRNHGLRNKSAPDFGNVWASSRECSPVPETLGAWLFTGSALWMSQWPTTEKERGRSGLNLNSEQHVQPTFEAACTSCWVSMRRISVARNKHLMRQETSNPQDEGRQAMPNMLVD